MKKEKTKGYDLMKSALVFYVNKIMVLTIVLDNQIRHKIWINV